MTEENPYLKMEDSVLQTHIGQINEVMESKSLSKLQAFGESLTPETTAKLEEAASVSQQLVDAKAKIPAEVVANPEVDKLAKLSLDRAVSDIKAIDEHIPLQGILDSSLNSFDKIEILGQVKSIATYSKDAIEAVKSVIPTKTNTPGMQGFGSAPDATGEEADKIFDKLVLSSGVKLD